MVDRLSEAVARWVQKVVRDFRASLSKRRSQTLLPAYGLWGKSSSRTEFPDHASSSAQQSDSPDAHFLSGAEKCCVSPLSANFRVFGFRSRPARGGVSRWHNLLCSANGLRLRISWSPLLASRERASTSAAPLRTEEKCYRSEYRERLDGERESLAMSEQDRSRRSREMQRSTRSSTYWWCQSQTSHKPSGCTGHCATCSPG